MAIAPTGAIYKTLTFDGVSSADFGVYITGEAVFNAPQRDVEMVTIPGRSGTFALDNGRFENIEVSYPAGIFADTEADFAEAVSEFRNFLCSRNGYVRLEDDYNPSEYRMAVYKSGLAVTPALLKAGEFTLTFDCKPQRWLISGEEAVTVESGDTITNPTRFEAEPMLEVQGGGTISFNGYNIELENSVYGDIELLGAGTGILSRQNINFNANIANTGDLITVDSVKISASIQPGMPIAFHSETATGSGYNHNYFVSSDGMSAYVEITDVEFEKGTASSIVYKVLFTQTGSSGTAPLDIQINYDGYGNIYGSTGNGLYVVSRTDSWDAFILHSSKFIIDGTIYIDCDLGEAYKYEGGEAVSLNQYIDLGSDLPTLGVGDTEITFDNTITNLDVIPRWWKV